MNILLIYNRLDCLQGEYAAFTPIKVVREYLVVASVRSFQCDPRFIKGFDHITQQLPLLATSSMRLRQRALNLLALI